MNVPSAPPRNPRTRRYPMSMVTLARQMYGDGDAWTPTQIRDYLRDHHGATGLSLGQVRIWVIPGLAEEQRRQNVACYRARKAAQRAAAAPAPVAVIEPVLDTATKRLRRLRALREAGLPYTAISKVFELDTGVHLTAEQLRYLLAYRRRRSLSKIWTRKLMGEAA